MELIIFNPTDDGAIQEIEFNNKEIKEHIDRSLEKYRGLIYDDNSIKTAKADKATLNNFKKTLDAKRIEIKNKYLEPYLRFEAKVKELTELIDQPMLAIDTQVKEYEARKKKEKRDQAIEIYQEVLAEYQELVSFESIEDPRWQNATFNLKEAREIMEQIRENLDTGIKIIKDKKSEQEATLMDVLFKTRDLGQVLKKEAELEQTKRILQAHNEMIREKISGDKIVIPDPPAAKEGKWYTFSLYLTDEEAADLGEWIRQEKIEARRVGN